MVECVERALRLGLGFAGAGAVIPSWARDPVDQEKKKRVLKLKFMQL